MLVLEFLPQFLGLECKSWLYQCPSVPSNYFLFPFTDFLLTFSPTSQLLERPQAVPTTPSLLKLIADSFAPSTLVQFTNNLTVMKSRVPRPPFPSLTSLSNPLEAFGHVAHFSKSSRPEPHA